MAEAKDSQAIYYITSSTRDIKQSITSSYQSDKLVDTYVEDPSHQTIDVNGHTNHDNLSSFDEEPIHILHHIRIIEPKDIEGNAKECIVYVVSTPL